jgi:predicted nucleic acid-binding protein
MQVRFLARLGKSFYRDNFILKGALLLLAYQIPLVRPSKDIDFLGRKTSNNTDAISSTIKQIAKIDLQDGVFFKQNALNVEQITEDSEYGGLRIKIPAIVGGDYQRLQLDIGFGDTMVDAPVDVQYPSLLEFPPPNIKVYSIESSIAEKFEAIVSLGLSGSRMKDFFDIWFLIQYHEINTERLQKAIIKTFYNRQKIRKVGIHNCAISEITYAELIYGAERSESVEKNLQTIERFTNHLAILPIFNAISVFGKEKARIRSKGDMISDFDLLIGATAISNNMIMVTRNVKEFKRLKLIKIENWIE